MKQSTFARLLDRIQAEEREVREEGQEEYAHDDKNAFRNFEAIAEELDLTREKVLWVYVKKHFDGILAWINGHRSQREDVRGRIKDARMYLALLWGMVEERERGRNLGDKKEGFREDACATREDSDNPVQGTEELDTPGWMRRANREGELFDDESGEWVPDTEENRAADMEKMAVCPKGTDPSMPYCYVEAGGGAEGVRAEKILESCPVHG